jgi:hypothetical protein
LSHSISPPSDPFHIKVSPHRNPHFGAPRRAASRLGKPQERRLPLFWLQGSALATGVFPLYSWLKSLIWRSRLLQLESECLKFNWKANFRLWNYIR